MRRSGLSDSSSSDGDDGQDEDPVPSFASIPTNKRFPLNVHGTYTKWGPREAFRELIQNWRDAIIESNNLASKDLCVERSAKGEANGEATPPSGDTEIVYRAYRRGAKRSVDCLGFVRYKGRNGLGTIEITNYKAALQTKDLCFGRTSKQQREDLAGAHGEGLKLAALALMRGNQNHRVFGRSTSFNLSFNFDKDGCLYVDAKRIKAVGALQSKTVAFHTPTVYADRDVQFIIGERRQGRNEFGAKVKRSLVQQKDFKSWAKVALFLTEVGDASIVSTAHGDLLTSADLHGNLYLKGLLLSETTESCSASVTGHPLGFGYNFAFGKTDRARHSLADAQEESNAICKILSEALKIKPDLVEKVCDLLNSAEPRYAEGECDARSWPSDIALLFKQHLLGGNSASRWLYSSDEMQQNPCLLQIIKCMSRQPFELTGELWGILVHHSLVHTSEKEAQRCYKNAPTVKVPGSSFAKSVNRLLRACVRTCPQTTSMKVEFVDPGPIHLHLHVLKKTSLIRIHKRWLISTTAVEELSLFKDVELSEVVAHTVKRLFADILDLLPREAFIQQDSARLPVSHMKQECHKAEQRLAKCQKMNLRIAEGQSGCSLKVEWAVNSLQQDRDSETITLHCHHATDCPHIWDDVLVAADVAAFKLPCFRLAPATPRGTPASGRKSINITSQSCRAHRVKISQGSHCEVGLQAGSQYFFVLVRTEDPSSFVAMSNNKRVVEQSSTPSSSTTAVASRQPFSNAPLSSFSLGTRLETQQFLELALAGDRLYNAENSQDVRAVICFVKGEKLHSEEPSKRRKAD